jgi:DNA-binding transcriptional ArsR family regulator
MVEIRGAAMVNTNRIAEIASLVGEPARAAMLAVLMDDRAFTAGELAREAGITPQTASTHLARLVSAQLLRVEKQGRHRLHRLATPEIARMLEGMMQIASTLDVRQRRFSRNDAALRAARTCYDHIAGHLGVAIAERMVVQGAIQLSDEAALLTQQGIKFLDRLGVVVPDDSAGTNRSTRPLCKPCLDWSERRPHIAGKVGAAILAHSLQNGWVRRAERTRALETTQKGRIAFRKHFGIAF